METLGVPAVDLSIDTFPVGEGNTGSAGAGGTVKNGGMVLYMRVEAKGRDPVVKQDECGESVGTAMVCVVSQVR